MAVITGGHHDNHTAFLTGGFSGSHTLYSLVDILIQGISIVGGDNDLGKRLGGATGPVTNNYVNGVNYSNDNAVGEAIGILVRAATMEGRA